MSKITWLLIGFINGVAFFGIASSGNAPPGPARDRVRAFELDQIRVLELPTADPAAYRLHDPLGAAVRLALPDAEVRADGPGPWVIRKWVADPDQPRLVAKEEAIWKLVKVRRDGTVDPKDLQR